LRAPTGRRSAAAIAVVLTALLVASSSTAIVAATAPPGLARFMAAVGSVESGGNYTARNPVSGAYGKYQIMPSNWPAWARQYLGDANAPQTPRNQDKVAAGKMTSLYRWLGSWRRVAYWWLTGSSQTTGWSSYARRYVDKVMDRYRSGGAGSTSTPTRTFNERSTRIEYHGTWRLARHGGYGGGVVRYASSKGASATFTFTGRSVAWSGPTGPTRGKAKVYIDGAYIKTVDLRSARFDPRATVFRRSWSTSSARTLTIVVVGTKGRPMVAIDDFKVAP
jgi:hypothetical protein